MPNLRRLKAAKIRFLSLCERGKNLFPVIFKSDDSFELQTLVKDDDLEARGELTAVVYAPEVRDAEGDIASPDVIKQMAYDFMKDTREGTGIDIRHNEKALPKEQAYVAESFIIQKNDPRFSRFKNAKGENIDVSDGWGVVLKIEDKELKEKYKTGQWKGISMGGVAKVEVEKQTNPDSSVEKVFNLILSHLSPKGAIEMTSDEMKALLKESNESLAKSLSGTISGALSESLKSALQPLLKAEPKKEDTSEPIVFEGDPSDPEDVKKHLEKVEISKLDWNNPTQVQKYLAKIEKAKGQQNQDSGPSINAVPGNPAPTSKETKIGKAAANILKFIPSSEETSKKTG